MFVSGVGRTKFGTLAESMPELVYQAIYGAVQDSCRRAEDIEAVFVSSFLAGPLGKQLHLNSVVASLLPKNNVPIIRVETACASGGVAVNQAVQSLDKYENVLVVGVEKMTGHSGKTTSEAISLAGDKQLDQSQGLLFPSAYALIAQQHMLQFGSTHSDLEQVALKNHANANLNPLAHFYSKKITSEDVRNAPVVSTPLNLFDCSPISDGAAAVVLSRHQKDKKRDVRVLASQVAVDTISLTQRSTLTSFPAAAHAAQAAYKQAKLTHKQIDFAEVHDCFTIAELVAMEDLGFSPRGKSHLMVRSGETKIGGKLPINPDGGLKADGHPIGASGVAQIFELVTQLRGEASSRQVDGAKVGLAHNIGGVGGTAAIHILGDSK